MNDAENVVKKIDSVFSITETGYDRSIVLNAHKKNDLKPYSKRWWDSLSRAYTYMYICSGEDYAGTMMEFCDKKKNNSS